MKHKISFLIAWALLWRMALINILFTIFIKLLGNNFINKYLFLLEFVSSITVIFISVFWLLKNSKIGGMKIILIDQAEYQKNKNLYGGGIKK